MNTELRFEDLDLREEPAHNEHENSPFMSRPSMMGSCIYSCYHNTSQTCCDIC